METDILYNCPSDRLISNRNGFSNILSPENFRRNNDVLVADQASENLLFLKGKTLLLCIPLSLLFW